MFEELSDIVSPGAEQLKYRFPVVIDTERLATIEPALPPLSWQSISYGEKEIKRVPDDRRGIYAFAIQDRSSGLPPHCYILYIGIGGKNSNRSLRARYRDYLAPSKIRKRAHIARMIWCWGSILRFYYAAVPHTTPSSTLQEIELQLNSALMPPFSINDIDAEVKKSRRAFP